MENNDCGCCGKCCEAIWLEYSKEELVSFYGSENYDVKFVVENWEEISLEEFKKINPFYHTQKRSINHPEKHFYKCNAFDKVTRKCLKHDTKPYVCSGYPLYNESCYGNVRTIDGVKKLHPNHVFYSEECVFKNALATEEEWLKDPE